MFVRAVRAPATLYFARCVVLTQVLRALHAFSVHLPRSRVGRLRRRPRLTSATQIMILVCTASSPGTFFHFELFFLEKERECSRKQGRSSALRLCGLPCSRQQILFFLGGGRSIQTAAPLLARPRKAEIKKIVLQSKRLPSP